MTNSWIPPLVNSKDGPILPCCFPFGLRSSSYDPTRRESRRTSDSALLRVRSKKLRLHPQTPWLWCPPAFATLGSKIAPAIAWRPIIIVVHVLNVLLKEERLFKGRKNEGELASFIVTGWSEIPPAPALEQGRIESFIETSINSARETEDVLISCQRSNIIQAGLFLLLFLGLNN